MSILRQCRLIVNLATSKQLLVANVGASPTVAFVVVATMCVFIMFFNAQFVGSCEWFKRNKGRFDGSIPSRSI